MSGLILKIKKKYFWDLLFIYNRYPIYSQIYITKSKERERLLQTYYKTYMCPNEWPDFKNPKKYFQFFYNRYLILSIDIYTSPKRERETVTNMLQNITCV